MENFIASFEAKIQSSQLRMLERETGRLHSRFMQTEMFWYNFNLNNNAANIEEEEETPQFARMRTGKLSEMDRSFDIEYWQRQGGAAIFKAAWERVELYYRENGLDLNELRLQKDIENFQRRSD